MSPPEGHSFELLVAGDRSAPDAVSLSIVERTLLVLDALLVQARAYLDEFVERSKFAEGNAWSFEAFESGRIAAEAEISSTCTSPLRVIPTVYGRCLFKW